MVMELVIQTDDNGCLACCVCMIVKDLTNRTLSEYSLLNALATTGSKRRDMSNASALCRQAGLYGEYSTLDDIGGLWTWFTSVPFPIIAGIQWFDSNSKHLGAHAVVVSKTNSVSKIQVFDPGPKGLGRQIALSAPTAADAKKKLPVDKDGGVRSGTDLAALGPANVYTPSFPWYPGMLGKYWGVFDGQLCEVSKAPLRLVSDPRAID
jgi:hypothetical protein